MCKTLPKTAINYDRWSLCLDSLDGSMDRWMDVCCIKQITFKILLMLQSLQTFPMVNSLFIEYTTNQLTISQESKLLGDQEHYRFYNLGRLPRLQRTHLISSINPLNCCLAAGSVKFT